MAHTRNTAWLQMHDTAAALEFDDDDEVPEEETALTIVCTDHHIKMGESHKTMDANAQKIAVMVFKELGIRRDKWSALACCRILSTVTKGSTTVAAGQYEHERHSVLTGVQMPAENIREILNKIDKRGQGQTALLKFRMAWFKEQDQGPGQETGAMETLSVEVGIKGDEHDFRCLGRQGIMLAEREDPVFSLHVLPDGAFNIETPAWQKVASTAIANGLQASFNGVKPRIRHAMAGHAFGVSAHSQADAVHIFQVEVPLGQDLPAVFNRVIPYPTGEISHADHGTRTALLMPVLARFMLDGKSVNGEFYLKGAKYPSRSFSAAPHKQWKQRYMRAREQQRKTNQAKRMPRRTSPRMTDSAKRRRQAATRAGGGNGPGSRALEALSEAQPTAEAAAASSSAAGASADMDDPLATQDQDTEVEQYDLGEGMETDANSLV